MPRLVEPKVFLIAETQLVGDVTSAELPDRDIGVQGFLAHLGVPDWATDAASPAEELIEMAGKTCYMSFSTELNRNLTKVGTRSNADYIQQGIVKTGHGSVLEHATVTFAFCDVSRVFTHELVRHRAGAAYSQTSGRYVRTDEIAYWLPTSLQGTAAGAFFHACFRQMEIWMRELNKAFELDQVKDFSRKKQLTSAFRRLIGNGQANNIIATFNHRALRHLIELRTAEGAEEEIREVFAQVFGLVHRRYPSLYGDAQMRDVDGVPEIRFTAHKI